MNQLTKDAPLSGISELRSILLDHDLSWLGENRSEIETLLISGESDALIVEKLKPHFISLFEEELTKDTRTAAKVLSPLISSSLKTQIQKERGQIVDALYPIMGSMITKYVAESVKGIVENLNDKVETNISWKGINRKMTAKLKGVSESDLLLREALSVEYILAYLIHAETGLVIAQSADHEEEDLDADMVAAALTAIKDFVSDMHAGDNTQAQLHSIEMGDETLIIEGMGSVFLAVVCRGDVRLKTKKQVQALFKVLLEKHSEDFSEYSGGKLKDQLQVESQINSFVANSVGQSDSRLISKNRKKKIALVLFGAIGLCVFLSHVYYKNRLNKFIKSKADFSMYNIKANSKGLYSYQFNGAIPDKSYKEKVLSEAKSYKSIIPIKLSEKLTVPFNSLNDSKKSSEFIKQLESHLSDKYSGQIFMGFYEGHLFSKGYVLDEKNIKEIETELAGIRGVDKYFQHIISLDKLQGRIIGFNSNSIEINDASKFILDEIKGRIDSVEGLGVKLMGSSDKQGTLASRKNIANLRAKEVSKYLIANGLSSEKINIVTSDLNHMKKLNNSGVDQYGGRYVSLSVVPMSGIK